jgi:predicted nuclease of predicted toxin-antitoxin system
MLLFVYDEGVPLDVAEMLRKHGHKAEYIRDHVPPGSPDPLVATVAENLKGILLSWDGDFDKIAPRVAQGQRARFRKLSRIWMRCREPQGAERLEGALELVVSEFALAMLRADQRLMMQIGNTWIRIDR